MTPLQQELVNLRAKLDIANATISDMRKAEAERVEPLIGVARMSKGEAKLVSVVARGGRVTFERVYSALYNHLDEPRAYATMKVVMCKARSKLRPHGITIKSIFGIGFEIDEADRNALRHLAGLPVVDSPSVCPAEQVAS
jgi:hypothetical protein